MRVLHVTHHAGCKIAVDFVCAELGHEVETQHANWNYNMSADLADEIWNEHKEYYNGFDVVVTSDTASLSRIFLQNNFDNRLIIWVCNRFDYHDVVTNIVGFPDPAFYDLFRNASNMPNVSVRSYTKFEHEYAMKYRNVAWDTDVVKPCNFTDKQSVSAFPDHIDKSEVFLVTRYHNDNIFMDLKAVCDGLGIPTYRGEYNGPTDLKGIRGIIHIPYAWSNLALFENWAMGLVYFIPSKHFLLELASTKPNFFWSPPFDTSLIESSEWYLPEHKDLFAYFDSFGALCRMTKDDEMINGMKSKIKEFSDKHITHTLAQWKTLFDDNIQ